MIEAEIIDSLDLEAVDKNMGAVHQVLDMWCAIMIENTLKQQFGVTVGVDGQPLDEAYHIELNVDEVRLLQAALYYWRWLCSIDRISRNKEPFDAPPWEFLCDDNGNLDGEKWWAELKAAGERFWTLFNPQGSNPQGKKPQLKVVK